MTREVADLAAVLGYAQIRSWAMGALGGPAPEPDEMVCLAVRRIEATHRLGVLEWSAVVPALVDQLRDATATVISERARARPMPWRPARCPLQLGDGEWLEAVIDAGGRAVPLSVKTLTTFDAAVRMVDFVRPRIEAARRRRTEDTRPIRRRP